MTDIQGVGKPISYSEDNPVSAWVENLRKSLDAEKREPRDQAERELLGRWLGQPLIEPIDPHSEAPHHQSARERSPARERRAELVRSGHAIARIVANVEDARRLARRRHARASASSASSRAAAASSASPSSATSLRRDEAPETIRTSARLEPNSSATSSTTRSSVLGDRRDAQPKPPVVKARGALGARARLDVDGQDDSVAAGPQRSSHYFVRACLAMMVPASSSSKPSATTASTSSRRAAATAGAPASARHNAARTRGRSGLAMSPSIIAT